MFDWLWQWAQQVVIWRPTAEDIATVVKAAVYLAALVQAVKRLVEAVESGTWWAKLLPPEWRQAIGALAHGWGARVLAALLTLATGLPVVLEHGLTAAEAINLVVALLTAMGVYELVRGKVGLLFPKRG